MAQPEARVHRRSHPPRVRRGVAEWPRRQHAPRPGADADAGPAAAAGRAGRILALLDRHYPDAGCRWPSPRRWSCWWPPSVGAVHGDGSTRSPDAVLHVRDAGRLLRHRSRDAGGADPLDGVFGTRRRTSSPPPDGSSPGTGARSRAPSRSSRRFPASAGRPPTSFSGTPSGSRASSWTPTSGGSPAARAHRRVRPGEDRARAHAAHPPRALGPVLPPAHRARPAPAGPAAALRRVLLRPGAGRAGRANSPACPAP